LHRDGKTTEDKAKEVCQAFLFDRYHSASYRSAKIRFDTVSTTEEEGVPAFYLEGELKVRGGTWVAQYLFPPDRYTFRMWVSSATGRILRWELN